MSPTTHPQPAQQQRGFTRDQLLAAGRAGRPWEFLPLGIQASRAMPGDVDLRFLLAAAFGQVGLRTAALEELAALPDALAAHPDITALRSALHQLPDDALPSRQRIEVCRANVNALAGRNVDLAAAFESWVRDQEKTEWFAACDANIPRRRRGTWALLGDHAGMAARFAAEHASSTGQSRTRSYFLEGVDPPWLLLRLHELSPRQIDEYQAPLHVVQADAQELLDGLALADLHEIIANPRTLFFVGDHASCQLSEHLRSRLHCTVGGDAISIPTIRTCAKRPIAQIVSDAESLQVQESARLAAELNELYQPRDRSWWAARYAAALRPGSDSPLRVLIPTSRYSTFIQHASRDLATTLQRRGVRAEVLIEPDRSARMSALAYQRAILELQPDLIVTINYTRANINTEDSSPVIPLNIPYVCWIQDCMAHLFDARIGARQSDLDFLVGHVFPELSARYAYPASRSLATTASAELGKFHDSPTAAHLHKKYECEIAYASNHSEPPEALRQRLGQLLGPSLAGAQQEIVRSIEESVQAPLQLLRPVSMHDRVLAALTRHSTSPPDARLVDVIARQFAEPYADRLLRHDTLAWAAEIAERRGWRFRLYGRGWEQSSRFSSFACGELAHAEDLRCAYQCAAAHLQMTQHTLVHQRLFECLLSGGFPLCRLHLAEFSQITTMYITQSRTPLVACASQWPMAHRQLVRESENPAFRPWFQTMRELGLLSELAHVHDINEPAAMIPNGYFADPSILPALHTTYSAFWLLGCRAEHFFHSKQSLEARLAASIQNPQHHRDLARVSAAKARERKSYEAFIDQLLPFVAGALSDGPPQ